MQRISANNFGKYLHVKFVFSAISFLHCIFCYRST